MVYTEVSTICSSRQSLGALEHNPEDKGQLVYFPCLKMDHSLVKSLNFFLSQFTYKIYKSIL